MSDVVERAEAALADPEMDLVHADRRIRELVAELKTTRARLAAAEATNNA